MSLRGLESVRVLSKTPKLETMPMFGRAKTGFGRLARVRLASLVLTHTNRLTRTGRTKDIGIYGAASPRRRPPSPLGMPPPPPPHPSPKPRLSFQQTVIRHPRNCPPKLGLAPWPTHGTTRQGTTGAGWGRITHNTGNHRAPSPSPPLRHTDDNDGDDVVHNDVDVLFPVWLLVVPFLLCCSGLRQRMFIALFS